MAALCTPQVALTLGTSITEIDTLGERQIHPVIDCAASHIDIERGHSSQRGLTFPEALLDHHEQDNENTDINHIF